MPQWQPTVTLLPVKRSELPCQPAVVQRGSASSPSQTVIQETLARPKSVRCGYVLRNPLQRVNVPGVTEEIRKEEIDGVRLDA